MKDYFPGAARPRTLLLPALAAVATLALVVAAKAPSEASSWSPEFQAVTSAVETAMQEAGVPGAAVGVYANGKEEIAAFGVTALDGTERVTLDTRFQNGSITKTYTATAILRLMDEGKVDLDSQVRTYLPDLVLADQLVADAVTVRQLMNHTGGWWGDAYIDTGEGDAAVARFLDEVLPRLPQVAPLGRFVTYNNSAFIILGRIIEVATGKDYAEAIDDLILEPLGLDDATYDRSGVLSAPHAKGHGEGANGIERVTPLFLPRNVDPAGGLWTTIEDELDYARFHLGDGSAQGERILEPGTITLMQTPATELPGGGGSRLGLPWLIGDAEGLTIVQHDGQTFGQSALLTLVPDHSLAVVVLTNSSSGAAVGQAAVNAVLSEYLGIGGPPPEQSDPTPMEIDLQPEETAAYIGHYQLPITTVDIEPGEGGLVAVFNRQDWPGQIVPSNLLSLPETFTLPLVFIAQDIAVAGSIEQPLGYLVFLRNDAGVVDWFSFNLRIYPRLE